MVRNFILLCLITILFSCQKSIEIKEFNTRLLQVVKDNSLYSDSINWHLLEKGIDSISQNLQTTDECSITVKYVIDKLKSIGDNHTLYISKKIINEMNLQNINTNQKIAKYLNDSIAYIKIPGFMSINKSICNDYATRIQLLIKTMDSIPINGWIVDLRENTGGNMYPMIVGLGPLLDDGILGYFIDKNGKNDAWFYRKGQSANVRVSNPYKIKNKNAKIAILISNKTGSSGEMTAISFIGQRNTKIFGQKSAGYTTGNKGFHLTDGSYICLATCFVADRNMRKICGGIKPDMIIYDYMYNDDRSLNEAVKWLKESR